MDVFWTLPPVSRTITAAAVVVSAAGYSGLLSLYHYIFVSQYVFTVSMLPQLWRLFTAFLITKPKFGILLDPYFLYQYGSSIERESPRFKDPGDFFVYTLFLGSVIVVSTHCTHAYIASIASTQLSATSRLRSKSPPHICPPSLLFLAEAVPGTEEEYPCTSCGSVIRNHIKGLVWCVGMVGTRARTSRLKVLERERLRRCVKSFLAPPGETQLRAPAPELFSCVQHA